MKTLIYRSLWNRINIAFLLVSLWSCHSKPSSPESSDPLVGSWLRGSLDCAPVDKAQEVWEVLIQTISMLDEAYEYKAEHTFFLDSECKTRFLTLTYSGHYRLGALLPKVIPPIRQMLHHRSDFKAVLSDPKGLSRANLLNLDGFEKGAGRLCQWDRDWILFRVENISGKSCGLDLDTQVLESAMALMQIDFDGKILRFSPNHLPEVGKYPQSLYTSERLIWHKL